MNTNLTRNLGCSNTTYGDIPIQTGYTFFGFPIVFVYAGQEIIWNYNLYCLEKRLEYLGLI